MSSIDIKITNSIPQAIDALRDHAAEKTESGAKLLRDTERRQILLNRSYRTGFMHNSTEAERVNDLEWITGNEAEYSPFVNYGTRDQTAKPFVEPSVDIVWLLWLLDLGNFKP